MEKDLAIKLQEVGFPAVTRWAVENNQRRPMTVTGSPALPSTGELLSELGEVMLWKGILFTLDEKNPIVWFADLTPDFSMTESKYADTEANRKNGYANKTFISGYIDDSSLGTQYGEKPEIALAKLYISIHANP